MYALWYSFKLRTVIVMQVKNYFLDCFGKHYCCFTWVTFEQSSWPGWLMSNCYHLHCIAVHCSWFQSHFFVKSHNICINVSFQYYFFCLLISSSCFRSPKLVCSNCKPLPRCVAHFQTKLLTAIFCLPHHLSFVFFWMQKSWDVTPLTIGWWIDVLWILYHLYVWLVTFHV